MLPYWSSAFIFLLACLLLQYCSAQKQEPRIAIVGAGENLLFQIKGFTFNMMATDVKALAEHPLATFFVRSIPRHISPL